MRILPVISSRNPSSRPENDTLLHCYVCPLQATFSTAAATGWTFDADGEPFRTYYCPAHRPDPRKERQP